MEFVHCTDQRDIRRKKEQRTNKRKTKASWYRPYQSILFCPPTPKGNRSENVKRKSEEGQDGGRNRHKDSRQRKDIVRAESNGGLLEGGRFHPHNRG